MSKYVLLNNFLYACKLAALFVLKHSSRILVNINCFAVKWSYRIILKAHASIAVGLRDSPAENAEHSILNYTFHAILL